MKSKIKNIKLRFNCDADWNIMTSVKGGRHCNSCNKTVYDFTDAKPYEFLQILAEQNNKICGRFRADQIAAEPIRIPVWKKWVSAVLVLIGINVFNHVDAQTHKNIHTKHHRIKFPPPVLVGDVEVIEPVKFDKMPSFPGSTNAMNSFIAKHIQYKRGMVSGTVTAAFGVNADGSLVDIRIIKSLGRINDEAVLSAIKQFPKWQPAISSGSAVSCSRFVIPVNF